MLPPRLDRLDWDDHHMLVALVTAQRSPDPNTQVGAVLVSKSNRILGTGYNGFPRGINSKELPWDRDPSLPPEDQKYAYVVHAEKNAISNAVASIEGSLLYVTLFPCNECAKDIIQAGIKEIIYLSNPYASTWQVKAAEKMFDYVGIGYRQHVWKRRDISFGDVLKT